MMDAVPAYLVRSTLGLVLGVVLGAVARRGRFCTLGAIEDVAYAGDTRRARAWMLAAGCAILGTHALETLADLQLERSIYAAAHLELGTLVMGGAMFGFGMALVGTCGFGSLLRLGGGDLRALVVLLVLGMSSYMAISGLTGLARVVLTNLLSVDLAAAGTQRLGGLIGLEGSTSALLGVGIALALAGAALAGRGLRQTPRLLSGGLGIGSLIVAGWWANGLAGDDAFEARVLGSFSFVRPVGETMMYAMLASGMKPDFGAASVLGVVIGAFAAARSAGEFHWEAPDDAREVKRHVVGAFLMGTGGVAALGCTIGQGLSGLSTLSIGSMLALASIIVGARGGLYYLVDRHA